MTSFERNADISLIINIFFFAFKLWWRKVVGKMSFFGNQSSWYFDGYPTSLGEWIHLILSQLMLVLWPYFQFVLLFLIFLELVLSFYAVFLVLLSFNGRELCPMGLTSIRSLPLSRTRSRHLENWQKKRLQQIFLYRCTTMRYQFKWKYFVGGL